jgi:hypothetical protein
MASSTCDLCGQPIAPHAHYIIRIDVFADPSVPPMTTEELEQADRDKTIEKLLDEMSRLSADELRDQVHRRFEYHLCPACHRRFLVNPLGLPRRHRSGEN